MNLEKKTLKQNFILYVIPSIISQWVFSLYTMVDGIFVARGVSEVALTAVNLVSPFVMALFAVSILFAVGTSTTVAILLGQKRRKQANEVFTQNIVWLVLLSLVITVLVMGNLKRVALFLGATDVNMKYVLDYLGTIAPFSLLFILSYSFETLLKTDGFPKLSTVLVTTGVVLNVILDYLMVIVLKMGIRGAALATCLSQLVLIVLYLLHFLDKKGEIKFCRFRFSPSLIWQQIRNGLSSGITEISTGITIFLFNQMILRYLNENALVSYTIISYMNSIVVMTMVGIVQGAQPLISYFYGKGNRESCRKLFRYGILWVTGASLTYGIGCIAFAGAIVRMFLSPEKTELFQYSVKVLRIFSLSFFVAGFNIIVGGYFTAIERAVAATVISMSRSIVALLAALVILTTLFSGAGIWWSPLLSEGITLVFSLFFFLYGYIR